MTLKTLDEAIGQRLAADVSSPVVMDKVADAIAGPIIEKRAAQIVASMANRDNLQKIVNRAKPDQVSISLDGTETISTYSAKAYKEITDAKARIEQIGKAIDAALSKNDYEPLNKLGAGAQKSADDAG
jgi:formate-dependent phosphoribosylglycinamide formyltransferase (GAR transformylase)